MNRNQYWYIIATTTFHPLQKKILDCRLKRSGISAKCYSLFSVSADAVGSDEAKRKAAIAKMKDPSVYWYMSTKPEDCLQVKKNLSKLKATDFLDLHGAFNTIPDVTFVSNRRGIEFHVNWMMNRKEADARRKPQPVPPVPPTPSDLALITDDAGNVITVLDPDADSEQEVLVKP